MIESHDAQNDAPDIMYILYKYLLVFNHFKNELTLIELLSDGENTRLHEIESVIGNRNFASYDFSLRGKEYSTITDEQYREFVRRGVAHCRRGDVFQIVLSRRFVQPYAGDDFKVYRALRSVNPSPYLFYFNFGGFRIFGSVAGNPLQSAERPRQYRSDRRYDPAHRRRAERQATGRRAAAGSEGERPNT